MSMSNRAPLVGLVRLRLARLFVAFALLSGLAQTAAAQLILDEAEIAAIVLHGPWPPQPARDASNRVSGTPAAITLGRALFFERRLSKTGTVSCATCHKPELGWADGRPLGMGIAAVDRNTPTVLDVGLNRWFGWDGRSDSLWAHSLLPVLDPREMGADADHVAQVFAGDARLGDQYARVFGEPAHRQPPQTVLVNTAKTLAAFQETLVSPRTSFDAFRDALAQADTLAAGRFPLSAQRGAKTFLGKGKCNLCHVGPAFTNGEFADAGLPYFISPGRVDTGRHGGIAALRASPFNRLGAYSDSSDPQTGWATRHVTALHSNFGEFRVPTLRHLTRTAPYMHNGSKATLVDVVRHYSEIDLDRIHADGVRILEPLGLSDAEIADLVDFLKSLSD